MRTLFLALLFTQPLFASYRVYKLKVVQYDISTKKNLSLEVMSTMDHLQYEHYRSGYGRMKVSLLDTWYCPGDTSRHKLCMKPKEKDIVRGLAAYDRAKRSNIPYNRQPVIP